MESLSLLKYLRGGGGAAIAAAAAAKRAAAAAAAAVPDDDCRAEDDATSAAADDDDDDDEGPFFDLEFTVPENGANGEEKEEEEEEEAEESEFDFAREGFRSEPLSPSDDLFFKGKLLTLDPSSIADADADPEIPPHLPVALLKPAAKLRVFLLRLRKPKPAAASSPPPPKPQGRSKLLVKLKVEESPIVSLFTRDNSSRNSASTAAAAEEEEDERRFAREVVHKYLSKIKPLYVRVSKRYGEKLGFPEAPSSAGAEKDAAEAEAEAEGEAEAAAEEAPPTAAVVAACGVRAARASIPGLKVVRRRLGKSRSASSAVASPRRRDDSLLQQEDGIQSAIAHCKRSFHSSAEGSESPFARCMSDPGDGRSEMEKEACV